MSVGFGNLPLGKRRKCSSSADHQTIYSLAPGLSNERAGAWKFWPRRSNLAYNLIAGLFREREPSIDLPYRIDVALTVIYDVGDFPGAVIRIDLRAVESFFRRRYAEGSGEQIEAGVFAAPFAPLMHRVENRRVAKTGERKVARWFDLMDDRALVDKPQIEIEYVVADEEIAIHGQFPKVLDNLGFFTLEHLDFGR